MPNSRVAVDDCAGIRPDVACREPARLRLAVALGCVALAATCLAPLHPEGAHAAKSLRWQLDIEVPRKNLFAVHALSADDVWVGANELLMHYDGAQWTSQEVDGITIKGLSRLSEDEGWAVGSRERGLRGGVLRLDGEEWVPAEHPDSRRLAAVAMASSDLGWAVGDDGEILRWQRASGWEKVESPTRSNLKDVVAASEDAAWVVGAEGTVLSLVGQHWEQVRGPSAAELPAIDVTDDGVLWIAAADGSIWRGDGDQWEAVRFPTGEWLGDISMISGELGWAVGSTKAANPDRGTVLRFEGGQWWYEPLPTADFPVAVHAIQRDSAWAVAFGGAVLRYGLVDLPFAAYLPYLRLDS